MDDDDENYYENYHKDDPEIVRRRHWSKYLGHIAGMDTSDGHYLRGQCVVECDCGRVLHVIASWEGKDVDAFFNGWGWKEIDRLFIEGKEVEALQPTSAQPSEPATPGGNHDRSG